MRDCQENLSSAICGGQARENKGLTGGKVGFLKRYARNGEGLSPQVIEDSGVGREGEAESIGVQGLTGFVKLPVGGAIAVFAVAEERTANFRHGNADLMGSPGQQTAFHKR